MYRRLTLSIACAALFLLSAAGAADARPTIAILGLEVVDDGGNLDAETMKIAMALTDALRERATGTGGPYELAPNSKKDLLEMKLLSGCADEAKACMAEIGKELSADRLLYGRLEKRKKGYQISLKLLDVRTQAMEKSTSDLIPTAEADARGLDEWAKTLYNRLTGVPEQGTLVVKANVDQGTVYVDGQLKGSLSGGTARIAGLDEGKHKVAVESPGHRRFDGNVTIGGGRTEEILVDLRPADGGDASRPGGVSRVLFWTSLVATGASAAGMTITGLQVRGPLEDDKLEAMETLAASGGPRFEGDRACDQAKAYSGAADVSAVLDACQRGRDRAMLTNVLVGTTVLGALATTYFYYRGYMAPKAATTREGLTGTKKRTKESTVRVTPSVGPTGVGAGVTIEF